MSRGNGSTEGYSTLAAVFIIVFVVFTIVAVNVFSVIVSDQMTNDDEEVVIYP